MRDLLNIDIKDATTIRLETASCLQGNFLKSCQWKDEKSRFNIDAQQQWLSVKIWHVTFQRILGTYVDPFKSKQFLNLIPITCMCCTSEKFWPKKKKSTNRQIHTRRRNLGAVKNHRIILIREYRLCENRDYLSSAMVCAYQQFRNGVRIPWGRDVNGAAMLW